MENFYADYYSQPRPGMTFLSLAIAVLGIIAMWKIFEKAGEPGWAAIIPFYNLYVLFKITWGNGWKFLLLLIPLGFMPKYFADQKLFRGESGLGATPIENIQVGTNINDTAFL